MKNKEITELNKKQVIMNRTNFEWDDITYSEHLARATLSGVNAEKGAWAQFETMENRNNQKRRSLRKLARVGCDMGGKAWTPQCDALNAFYAEQDGEIKDIKKALAMLVAQGAPAPAMAATTAAPASGGFMDGWMNVAACETSGPLVFGTQNAPVLTDSTRVVHFNADGDRGWVTVDFRASEPRCRAHYHAFRETSADHQGLASGHVC